MTCDPNIIELTERNTADLQRPAWGLTAAIPEGAPLAWGARAIYSWRTVKAPVTTKTGRIKISRGQRLMSTTYEPVIELLFDRQGWSSGLDAWDGTLRAAQVRAMGTWIDKVGLPAINAACRKRSIQTTDDGPSARVEFSSDGYTIAASPNGSCGYLYLAAWKIEAEDNSDDQCRDHGCARWRCVESHS